MWLKYLELKHKFTTTQKKKSFKFQLTSFPVNSLMNNDAPDAQYISADINS